MLRSLGSSPGAVGDAGSIVSPGRGLGSSCVNGDNPSLAPLPRGVSAASRGWGNTGEQLCPELRHSRGGRQEECGYLPGTPGQARSAGGGESSVAAERGEDLAADLSGRGGTKEQTK